MRKNKHQTINIIEEKERPFQIYQFVKLDGIRGKRSFKTSPFVSPIFGESVKDEVTAPFVARNTGDTGKKYDAFRTVPKINPTDKSKKYYEFTDIVTHETRKEYFGEDTYIKKTTSEKKQVENKGLKVLFVKSSELEKKDNENYFKVEENVIPTFADVSPIETKEEFGYDTYQRKEEKDDITSNTAFENFKEEKTDQKKNFERPRETVKPVVKANKSYRLPNVSMFSKVDRDLEERPKWLLDQITLIDQTLTQFGIEGKVSSSKKGPTVTRYEIELDPGVNVKRVSNIQDNIMMNLAAKSLRIEAPIPGKPYVGIEVPNVETEIVAFGNVIDQKEFLEDHEHPLKVALGVDIDGTNIYVDIAKMPHGLIAGATNSGKSVCVNTLLVSLLLKNTPDDLRLILIDPKMVELTPYNNLPHLITPVITDARLSSAALTWAVEEMEKRYQIFANSRSRDIKGYNDQVKRGIVKQEKMPYIVIIIDELADLMMVAAHDVEDAIQRITQKARAAGIHLIVATQRPTTDVVKGTIKSNIPTRIAFRVASFVDSTTILDGSGAELLLGKGDMLLKEADRFLRLQGAYIPDNEIYDVTDFIREQQEPNYIFRHEELKNKIEFNNRVDDELFEDVAYFVVHEQNASINSIQKEFTIGFNRAQKLIELLESYQIVSQNQGTKAREVLVTTNELAKILGHNSDEE